MTLAQRVRERVEEDITRFLNPDKRVNGVEHILIGYLLLEAVERLTGVVKEMNEVRRER